MLVLLAGAVVVVVVAGSAVVVGAAVVGLDLRAGACGGATEVTDRSAEGTLVVAGEDEDGDREVLVREVDNCAVVDGAVADGAAADGDEAAGLRSGFDVVVAAGAALSSQGSADADDADVSALADSPRDGERADWESSASGSANARAGGDWGRASSSGTTPSGNTAEVSSDGSPTRRPKLSLDAGGPKLAVSTVTASGCNATATADAPAMRATITAMDSVSRGETGFIFHLIDSCNGNVI